VRTPMQWSPAPQAGFSSAHETVRPVITRGPFGYPAVNVKTEETDAQSLLRWTQSMVALRKACPEIGYGTWRTVSHRSGQVLILHYSWRGRELTIVHNFSPEDREVDLPVKEAGADRLMNLLDNQTIMPEHDRYTFHMKGHDYIWLRGTARGNTE